MTDVFDKERYQLGVMLAEAMRGDAVDTVRLRAFLDAGAVLDVPDAEDGLPPLLWCVRRDQVDLVRMLLDAGANPAQTTRECGLDAVMVAAIYNSMDAMGVLIGHGCALCARDAFGHYAIQHAISGDHADMVSLLLDHRPDMAMVVDWRGMGLLQMARHELRHKAVAVLEAFEQAGRSGTTPTASTTLVRRMRPKGGR